VAYDGDGHEKIEYMGECTGDEGLQGCNIRQWTEKNGHGYLQLGGQISLRVIDPRNQYINIYTVLG
jgi:hypothetical protein